MFRESHHPSSIAMFPESHQPTSSNVPWKPSSFLYSNVPWKPSSFLYSNVLWKTSACLYLVQWHIQSIVHFNISASSRVKRRRQCFQRSVLVRSSAHVQNLHGRLHTSRSVYLVSGHRYGVCKINGRPWGETKNLLRIDQVSQFSGDDISCCRWKMSIRIKTNQRCLKF